MYRQFFPVIAQHPKRYFFDNAATTQYCQATLDATQLLNSKTRANVARSTYQEAEFISDAYEQARQTIADLLAVKSNEIIFCRGTTDALNIAARCLIENLQQEQAVLISDAEHHSNFLPWLELCKQRKKPLYRLPVNANGAIDFTQLEHFRDKNIAVVAITHCSNVTGVISDIALLAKWCQKNNAKLVLDGAQMIQHKLPNIAELEADVYCLSGHKAFASSGIGILYAKEELLEQWQPISWGGGMILKLAEMIDNPLEPQNSNNHWFKAPQKFEAGTPPYQQAIILAKALEWFASLEQTPLQKHHQALFHKADEILQKYDFVNYIHNPKLPRHPIFAFNIEGLHPHDAAQLFDSHGFCLRAGHHCAKPLMKSLQSLMPAYASVYPVTIP